MTALLIKAFILLLGLSLVTVFALFLNTVFIKFTVDVCVEMKETLRRIK